MPPSSNPQGGKQVRGRVPVSVPVAAGKALSHALEELDAVDCERLSGDDIGEASHGVVQAALASLPIYVRERSGEWAEVFTDLREAMCCGGVNADSSRWRVEATNSEGEATAFSITLAPADTIFVTEFAFQSQESRS